MSLLKTALFATAIYGTYRLLTDRDELTGKTVIDDLQDRIHLLRLQAKQIKTEVETAFDDLKEPTHQTLN
jgi:hypothetical protein